DGIIAVSQDVKTAILETMFGISIDKIFIIRNCVDIKRYQLNIDRQKVRQELGFTENDRLGVVVATFKRQKGHQYLIEAAATLMSKYPDLHLLFVGDGELESDLKNYVDKLGLENKIHFLGSRSDVPKILA